MLMHREGIQLTLSDFDVKLSNIDCKRLICDIGKITRLM